MMPCATKGDQHHSATSGSKPTRTEALVISGATVGIKGGSRHALGYSWSPAVASNIDKRCEGAFQRAAVQAAGGVAAYLQLGIDLLLGPATQGGTSQQHHGRACRKHKSSTEGGQHTARAREAVLEGRLGRLPGEALAVLRHLEAGHRHPACRHGQQGAGHDHSAGEAARGPAGDKQGPGSRCWALGAS